MQFINQSDNKFVDISSEEYRTYVFSNKEEIKINGPLQLSVSTGGHRLFDASGVSHYVPKGWIHLYWKAKQGSPHFVK